MVLSVEESQDAIMGNFSGGDRVAAVFGDGIYAGIILIVINQTERRATHQARAVFFAESAVGYKKAVLLISSSFSVS